jgi:hypothetical protein
MVQTEEQIQNEVKLVGGLAIIPSMLQVICRTTGMGFAAVAKVTEDRWIACGVRDEINFGLKPGGELKVDTTICDEIRESEKGVIIDHVETDPDYCTHLTPKMYGFQSYISIPVILRNGVFFGTLCAIDPNPANLKNMAVVEMFNLFTDLLSFHISALHESERQRRELHWSGVELRGQKDEVLQFRHISDHTLQEPLRKIRLFSDLLIGAVQEKDEDKTMYTAERIHYFATDLTQIVKDITDYTGLDLSDRSFKPVALEEAFKKAFDSLQDSDPSSPVNIRHSFSHEIIGIEPLVLQLFTLTLRHFLLRQTNMVRLIAIESADIAQKDVYTYTFAEPNTPYCQIRFSITGRDVHYYTSGRAFEMTPKANRGRREGLDTDLAMSRKIVRLLGGTIDVESIDEETATIRIILPGHMV